MISYLTDKVPGKETLMELYGSVGWTAYTREPEKLHLAVQNSLLVVAAYEGDKLVGLARAVGDGYTILYVQDILVDPEFRRKGIGTRLFNLLLEAYPQVRQKVLLTDDQPDTRAFYNSMGFRACDDGVLLAFARYDI